MGNVEPLKSLLSYKALSGNRLSRVGSACHIDPENMWPRVVSGQWQPLITEPPLGVYLVQRLLVIVPRDKVKSKLHFSP